MFHNGCIILRRLSLLLLAAVLLGAGLGPNAGVAAAATQRQGTLPLFSAASPDETKAAQALERPTLASARRRFARLNLAALESAGKGSKLELNLFDDVDLSATVTAVSQQSGGTQWTGSIDGDPLGQFFLVAKDGQAAADISMLSGIYQVRYAGAGLYAIHQIDQSKYPEEAPPVEVGTAAGPAAGIADPGASAALPAPAADTGSTLDVLVVYTPAARSAEGGATAMLNLIDLAVLETNRSYANSAISQRLTLVYAGEIAYTEALPAYGGMQTDLALLRGAVDGFMDNVHSLRNTYHADLVDLIVNSTEYCGIAYLMDTIGPAFASSAFSVVSSACATGYYSFGHELGHNMGARHDWYVDSGVTPSAYSHGYVNLNARWRTIMAYDSDCTIRGFNCTRLQYWANPSVYYGGQPMGIPAGTNATCRQGDKNHPLCDADDHRTLNDTAYTVANFRLSVPYKPFWDYPDHVFLPLARK